MWPETKHFFVYVRLSQTLNEFRASKEHFAHKGTKTAEMMIPEIGKAVLRKYVLDFWQPVQILPGIR